MSQAPHDGQRKVPGDENLTKTLASTADEAA